MTASSIGANFRLPQLGPIMQLAFVPDDWDAALRFWTGTMGVGPFFVSERVKVEKAIFRGKPVELDFDLALSCWGDLQIELIRQRNDSPSVFKEWRDNGRRGPHHVCVDVDDIEGARQHCIGAEGTVEQEFVIPGAGAIFVQFPGAPFFLEVVQLPARMRDRNRRMRQIAERWSGEEPIRSRLDCP